MNVPWVVVLRALNKQALQEAPSAASLKSLDRAALCAGSALIPSILSATGELRAEPDAISIPKYAILPLPWHPLWSPCSPAMNCNSIP